MWRFLGLGFSKRFTFVCGRVPSARRGLKSCLILAEMTLGFDVAQQRCLICAEERVTREGVFAGLFVVVHRINFSLGGSCAAENIVNGGIVYVYVLIW